MKHATFLAPALVLLTALCGTTAYAQYKIVAPDGTVTFTDRMPDQKQGGRVSNVTTSGAERPAADMPFELRQVAQKYPVTIYTLPECDACKQGRELLVRRGIPFSERAATTQADKALWEKITGSTAAPVLMVGKQQLRGFGSSNWNETLDAAGYPATSKLPTNYRHAEAVPLAPREVARTTAPAPAADAPVASTPSAPGGIRF